MFRAESFNVSNTPHFGGVQNNLAAPEFGALTAADNPRVFQFALKFGC
jgi:hypothetical protein